MAPAIIAPAGNMLSTHPVQYMALGSLIFFGSIEFSFVFLQWIHRHQRETASRGWGVEADSLNINYAGLT